MTHFNNAAFDIYGSWQEAVTGKSGKKWLTSVFEFPKVRRISIMTNYVQFEVKPDDMFVPGTYTFYIMGINVQGSKWFSEQMYLTMSECNFNP